MDEARVIAECEARVGSLLGEKWRLDRLIGLGASAAVYEARGDGRAGAVKILHSPWAAHPTIRARFEREAKIGNTIDHPGTVHVLDAGVSDAGEPYLVMELLSGASLDILIEQHRGNVPTSDALWITDGILSVLESAHALGIVHRDLKPENVFLTNAGVVKVLDFGIAQLRESRKDSGVTVEGTVMGTPAFMAPEQALGRWSRVDARSDIWSVGAILFTLLSGRQVHGDFQGNEMLIRAATSRAPTFAKVMPASKELCHLIDTALAFDPKTRYPDAASMRRAVQGLLEVPEQVPQSVRAIVDAPPVSLPPRSLAPAELTARVAAESVVDPRFARSVIKAYQRADARGAPSRVTEAVRAGLRQLAAVSPEAALELILTLFREFDAAGGANDPGARESFAGAVVSTRALAALLQNAGKPGVDRDAASRALTLVLDLLGDAHAGVALEALEQDPTSPVRDILIDYVARSGRGYEEPLAELLPRADASFAMVLLAVLGKMKTEASRSAILRAKESPDQEVRDRAELLTNES